MDYIEISFHNSPGQNELLIALLSDDFESFEETDQGLNAYVPAKNFSENKIKEVIERLRKTGNISYSQTLIKDRNWNALWESNFEPVLIGSEVLVRAPFHPANPGIKYEVIIEPKMSFGTGHHATTSLVMEEMLRMNMQATSVLDMGCGSGILAILADKIGAKSSVAIDVEEWAFNNAQENCRRNQSQHIIVQKGDVTLIQGKAFDVILANINRNILLQDMTEYVAALKKNGHLLISGFIAEDVPRMIEAGGKQKLIMNHHAEKNNWAMIHFCKG